jgi:alpha-beta hydrolase superfamily lysophospholipase
MRRVILWIAEHPTLTVSLLLFSAIVLLNVLAYRHARSMTCFVPSHRRNRATVHWLIKPLSLFEKARLVFNGVEVEHPVEAGTPDWFDLPYECHSVPGDAGQLHAWYMPQEHASGLVVLFHGYLACKARLLPEARAFHDLGYSCFLVDFRGCGDSEGDRTSIGYHEADDVKRAVDYAQAHWPDEPLLVFGQSMGAAAVLRALAQHTIRPDAVVLECPFDRLLSTVEARFAVTGLPAFPAAQLMVFWGGVQHGYNGFTHNPVEYARRVTRPVLMLHGTRDARVSSRQFQSVYDNLRGEKQLHFFEGLGHESYAGHRADEWKECVARFLHSHTLVP